MKCQDCLYMEILTRKDTHAFDVFDKRMNYTEDVEYCNEHLIPCEDAYLNCPYREITVEAQHIQHVINLLKESYYDHKLSAIEQLQKILMEEV